MKIISSKTKRTFGTTIAVVLALGLLMAALPPAGAAAATPLQWNRVNTPSEKDLVLLPGSDIYDFAVGPDGDTIYAIGELSGAPKVWKSSDGGETWLDLTAKVQAAKDLPPGYEFEEFTAVAVAPDNNDLVAVAGNDNDFGPPESKEARVVLSKNGGSAFDDSGDLEDSSISPATFVGTVTCMAISPEVDGVQNVAIGGTRTIGVLGTEAEASSIVITSAMNGEEDATPYIDVTATVTEPAP